MSKTDGPYCQRFRPKSDACAWKEMNQIRKKKHEMKINIWWKSGIRRKVRIWNEKQQEQEQQQKKQTIKQMKGKNRKTSIAL